MALEKPGKLGFFFSYFVATLNKSILRYFGNTLYFVFLNGSGVINVDCLDVEN